MHFKKRISIFVALLSLTYSVSLIQNTYAKYVSSAEANSNINIARWNITVNTQDVIQNSNFTNNLTPVFTENQYIKENVIAPTSEGYFDIIIDGTNADVSFKYTITLNPSNEQTIKDFEIVKYTIEDIDYTYSENITGVINYNDTSKTKSIRVYFKWNDDAETQQMNNSEDTLATTENNANYNVNINLIQISSQSN